MDQDQKQQPQKKNVRLTKLPKLANKESEIAIIEDNQLDFCSQISMDTLFNRIRKKNDPTFRTRHDEIKENRQTCVFILDNPYCSTLVNQGERVCFYFLVLLRGLELGRAKYYSIVSIQVGAGYLSVRLKCAGVQAKNEELPQGTNSGIFLGE